jgi:hypothetical protein
MVLLAEAIRWIAKVFSIAVTFHQVSKSWAPQLGWKRLCLTSIGACLSCYLIGVYLDPMELLVSTIGPLLRAVFLSNIELGGSKRSQNVLGVAIVCVIYFQPTLDIYKACEKRSSQSTGCLLVFSSTLYSLVLLGLFFTKGLWPTLLSAFLAETLILLGEITNLLTRELFASKF